MKQYLLTDTFQKQQGDKGDADTLQKAIMDYMSEAETQDIQKKLDDFTRKAGETIREAMRRYQVLMEPISHVN